jgi:predicted hydrocarbon binding protein
MEPIPESGLYYPNNLARITLIALEDVMGTNGLNAILNLAGQSQLIGNYPPDDMENKFDFAKLSSIIGGMEDMYGPRGARILAMRAGYATFNEMLINIGEAVDINDEGFMAMELTEKVRVGFSLVGITFTQSTKNTPAIQEDEDHFTYSVKSCPVCWGRTTDEPACFLITGLLRGSLRWITHGQEFNVTQSAAHSCGSPSCDFLIPKLPIS